MHSSRLSNKNYTDDKPQVNGDQQEPDLDLHVFHIARELSPKHSFQKHSTNPISHPFHMFQPNIYFARND